MEQRVSVITLGVDDLDRSKRFYIDGFGWQPVFENAEIVFYQLNGIVLGTYLREPFAKDANLQEFGQSSAIALAHNTRKREEVEPLMARLAKFGGRVTRDADAPPHGGFRGYVADPDGHLWEIAWNPGFAIDDQGNISVGQ